MKKPALTTILLLAFPLLMVLLASGPAGVTVFDGVNTAYYSWHQVVEKSSMGWCAPMAVVMNYAVFALAVFYLLRKKTWCLKAVFILSFIASCVAALPIVVQSDVKVVPNAFGMILLMAESGVAYVLTKKTEAQTEKPKGKRLDRR